MSDARLEQFKADIADMRIRDPAVGRESLLLWAGVAGLVAGIALTIISYFLSKNTNSALDQADYHIVALIGVAVTVAGPTVRNLWPSVYSPDQCSPLIVTFLMCCGLFWTSCMKLPNAIFSSAAFEGPVNNW